ncbi:MAG TPA: serine/threonine-protein kinase [Gemmatimonadales bacterium]|nr:serine/threonine-protein kinase [Gemmatimonadales bacterium]
MNGTATVISPSVDRDPDALRRTAARAMGIGAWVWPAFTLLDAWMCFVAYPGAPFGLFVAYRLGVLLLFLAVWHASRRPDPDIRRLFYLLNITYGLTALVISLMAVHLGGTRSPYMHGISIVALIRAAVVPGHWRRALPTYVRIGLAFPLVMGLGAAISPLARAEWLTPESLTVFASNYVFVLSSSVLGLISGHLVWAAQEQVYRARRVGRYRLQAPIGRGGMGEVWLAWDQSLRREVALKLLRVGTGAGPEMVKRFEREAQAAGRLQGAHVVRIFDFGASDDGLYYIAMEYIDGIDLAQLVEREGPLPPARAAHLMQQACLALEEAHAAGIIHRDIKPNNLIVTRGELGEDVVKLVDFGVARLREPAPGAEHLTHTGLLIGTPAYLAPELWEGREASEKSDIYALGVTLHFLLTGSTPRDTTAGTRLPPELEPVVRRCLAARPEERVPSARALWEALEVEGAHAA